MDDKADQMITDLLTHGAFGLQRKNWGQFNTHPAVMIGYLIPMWLPSQAKGGHLWNQCTVQEDSCAHRERERESIPKLMFINI